MLRSALSLPRFDGPRWRDLPPAWRIGAARFALAWLVLPIAFAHDWATMAGQWWDSSTYNHILVIPVILAWLVWQRLPELVKIKPVAWWPGLVAMGGALLVWLLGAVSGLDLARQAGAVGVMAAAVPLLLGPRVAWALLFPLAYMAFLVPFGDELITVLQTITARITITLVNWSGIPALIDGVFIETPAGLFEVAEACSGVKFLIAMIAFGVLAANVCFISWTRRFALLAACLVVPIVANGVRAWGTIFAAQYVGIEKAAGIDHIIYGWAFFAIVLMLVIAGAWRFFDRPVDDPMIDGAAIAADPRLARLERARIGGVPALLAVAALVAGVHGWAFAADRLAAPLPRQIALPPVAGWHRVDYAPAIWWEPRAGGAEHRLLGRYADDAGHEVDVFIALYSGQGDGREAGGFGEGALMPDSDWAWQADAPGFDGAKGQRLLGGGRVERLALTWYRTGGMMTGSNLHLKLTSMADRVLLRSRPTALLILSAEDRPGGKAAPALAAFRASTGPLDQWMDRVAAVR
ncbi:exosortase A [Novosphingobium album (ex Liu et al. 2023)]|uniref:Exosortase A n=1 Tax=Novosphingobium album (ex Liu et al. 2023) TaxID=3031130 RepID=A0ABT5WUF9_9SPHN|nr:exosortase A [Novosphingobium album (ex Liu et al. 2023)]MDE8653532.1 exosortase A [Novosphingobium album (ex Liu et al. 2023)]